MIRTMRVADKNEVTPWAMSRLRLWHLRIHLDPMVAHAGFDLLFAHAGDDQVGVLDRHVAIDTVFADLLAEFDEFAAIFVLVALEAFFGVHGRPPFRCVDFVTSGAGHLRGLVAAASLRERDLIAVDVYAKHFPRDAAA
jgi:hypothetical protein